MATNNYKPTGQLVGNTPAYKSDTDTAPNKAGFIGSPKGSQPEGTRFIGVLEGSESATWNRGLTEISKNVDRVRGPLKSFPVAVPKRLHYWDVSDLGDPSGHTTLAVVPTGSDFSVVNSFDGWVYHGTNPSTVSAQFKLLNSDGTEVGDSAFGVPLTVTDINQFDTATPSVGVKTTLFLATVGAPYVYSDPRHQITLSQSPVTSETLLGSNLDLRGCRVNISGSSPSAAGALSNDGEYAVLSGTSSDTSFQLVECKYRLRVTGFNYMSGEDVFTGSDSGATAYVDNTLSNIGSAFDWVEFETVTGSFKVGESITASESGQTGRVLSFTCPGDPAVLNNQLSTPTYGALFTTDGSFSRRVTLTLSGAIPNSSYPRTLVVGSKGFMGDANPSITFADVQVGSEGLSSVARGLSVIKGSPYYWSDPPLSVLGSLSSGEYPTYIDLGAAFNRELAADSAIRGYPSAVAVPIVVQSGTFISGENVYSETALTGTLFTATSGLNALNGTGSLFLSEVFPGSAILVGGLVRTVLLVTSNTSLTITSTWSANKSVAAASVAALVGPVLNSYCSATTGDPYGGVDMLVLDVVSGNSPTGGNLVGAVSGAKATGYQATRDARTIAPEVDPVRITGRDPVQNGLNVRSLLEVDQGSGVAGVRIRADQLVTHTGDRREVLALDGSEDYDRANSGNYAPSSVLGIKVPVYLGTANVLISDNLVSYNYAASKTTVYFGGNVDLTTFYTSAPFTSWPTNTVVMEIYDCVDRTLNGLWIPHFATPTTVELKRLGATLGFYTAAVSPSSGSAKVRFWARSLVTRGYVTDESGNNVPVALSLALGNGESGILLNRIGATSQTLLSIDDDSTQRLGVLVDMSTGSYGDTDYVNAPTLHADKIRSASDLTTAGANGTRYIDLTSNQAINFYASRGGGASTLLMGTISNTFVDNLLTVQIPTSGRGALTIQEEWELSVLDGSEGTLDIRRAAQGSNDTPYTPISSTFNVNAGNVLKLNSPTQSTIGAGNVAANIGAGDFVEVVLGNDEVKLAALGYGDGYPIVAVSTGVVTDTYAVLSPDSGTQSIASSAGKKPLMSVSDIRYGAGYVGYVGKVNTYNVPITGGSVGRFISTTANLLTDMSTVGEPWWFYVDDDIEQASYMMNPHSSIGSYVLQIPPLAEGSSGEASLRALQSVASRMSLGNGSDSVCLDLYYGEYSGSSYEWRRIARDYLRISVPGGTPTLRAAGTHLVTTTPSHWNKATAGTANSITLNAVEAEGNGYSARSSYDGLYNGWTVTIVEGAGAGQSKTISTYITGVATISGTFSPVPDNTSVYCVSTDEVACSAGRTFFLRIRAWSNLATTKLFSVAATVRTTSLISAP